MFEMSMPLGRRQDGKKHGWAAVARRYSLVISQHAVKERTGLRFAIICAPLRRAETFGTEWRKPVLEFTSFSLPVRMPQPQKYSNILLTVFPPSYCPSLQGEPLACTELFLGALRKQNY